jgi:hypothetical protein
MHRWLTAKATGAALALTVAVLSVSTAFADPRDFELINNTGQDIEEIYVGPSNEVDWGDNIIPDGKILPHGNKVPVNFRRFRDGDCLYDIKVVTTTGDEGELAQVNLCETTTVTFNR